MDGQTRTRRGENRTAAEGIPLISALLKNYSLWQIGVISFLACLVLFLSLYNIGAYPSPDEKPGYIDDALHLIASKNLALNGKYDFGPALGPTVFLPIAGAMRLFGANHLPGHLVMVAYLLANLLMFYLLVRFLGNWKVAVAATLIYVVTPGVGTIYLGRHVMGEVPATMFMLAGILVWFKSLDDPASKAHVRKLLFSGVLLGLAVVTKNQYLLLVPAWIAAWVLNRLYYRQGKDTDFLLPILSAGAIVLAWYGAQYFLLPNGQQLAAKNLSQWKGAASRGLLTFSRLQMTAAVDFLASYQVLFGMALPALLYAALRSINRSREGLRWFLMFVIGAGWLTWYTFLSVAWYRYAFAGLTLTAIFLAFFFHDATGGFNPSLKKLADLRFGKWDMLLVGKAVLIALFAFLVARNMVGRIGDAVRKGCDTHLQMVNYISKFVPANDVIETYQPEICLLSGHACHLPPGEAQDAVIRYVWYGGAPPSTTYSLKAPYVLIGYTSFYSGLYDLVTLKEKYYLEMSMGEVACHYDLYRLKPGN